MATNNAANIGTAAAGKVLQGAGAGVAPTYSTATYPSTATSTGTILRADGTNWVASTPTYPNSASTSGKVVVSDGTNLIMSTPTFPNASATSRKIIVSDGTNWVASTETYAVPGTSGNVLTSDGTNWTSAAPSGGGYAIYYTGGNTSFNPADSTTYYMATGVGFTTSHPRSYTRMYIPTTGTITKAYGNFYVSGTLGSSTSSTVSIRLNDTTDTSITTTLNLSSADVNVSNTGLSISVTAGDYVEIKWATPAWPTNPTSVFACMTIFIT